MRKRQSPNWRSSSAALQPKEQPVPSFPEYSEPEPGTHAYPAFDAGAPERLSSEGNVDIEELGSLLANAISDPPAIDWTRADTALLYPGKKPNSTPPLQGLGDAPSAPVRPDRRESPKKPEPDQFASTLPKIWQRIISIYVGRENTSWNRNYLRALGDYNAAMTTFNRMESEVDRQHEIAMSTYESELKRFKHVLSIRDLQAATNQKRYDEVMAIWKKDKEAWEKITVVDRLRLNLLRKQYLRRDPRAVEAIFKAALSRIFFPECFPYSTEVVYEPNTKTLAIELLLPNLEESSLFKFNARDKIVPVNKTERTHCENVVPVAVAIRVLHECAKVDYDGAVDSIAFNGMIRFTDGATGKLRTECILSVIATRKQILDIDVSKVDPIKCFRALKGLAAAELKDKIPVAPMVVLDRKDKRIIPGRDVFGQTQQGQNLAMMGWEDFEHFIRQLFEAALSNQGVEVKVTQSSRDRGVDAIAFDPDPIRGGKIVIQAKRYTRTVDVSSVRDLYGTVLNEGANRGILVTTSSFGPDAYDFAKDKPLTLIDGARLLYMLQQQGREFRIDLEEARRLGNLAD